MTTAMKSKAKTVAPVGFQAGAPHGWLLKMAGHQERIVLGHAAQELLDGDLPDRAGLAVLSVWEWAAPGISMGRKSQARGGGSLLMPIRISYEGGPVQLVTLDSFVATSWTSIGLGVTNSGTTTITTTTSLTAPTDSPKLQPPASLVVPALSRSALRKALRQLVDDGRAARWDAMKQLDPIIIASVRRAHAAVAYEVTDAARSAILDETEMLQAETTLKLGAAGTDSHILRLVDKVLDPAAFIKADPLKVFTLAIHRDAEQVIRGQIGDPRIGRQYRKFAIESGITDDRELRLAWNEAHPRNLVRETPVEGEIDRAAVALATPARLRLARPWGWASGEDITTADIADGVVDSLTGIDMNAELECGMDAESVVRRLLESRSATSEDFARFGLELGASRAAELLREWNRRKPAEAIAFDDTEDDEVLAVAA